MDIKSTYLHLEPFVPLFSLETAHSQTLLGHFLKSQNFSKKFTNEFLILPDGDCLSLHIHQHRSDFVVVVFHGLGGTAASDYMQRTAHIADILKYSVVLVEHRGAGLAQGKARYPYHSGRGDDASHVSQYLRKIFPEQRQIFIGFSMSGSIVLNLVTQRFGKYLPDFAVVVNAPIQLETASRMLQKGFSRCYDIRFYQMLKKMIAVQDPSLRLPIWGTTQSIDLLYTSQKSGFEDDLDYYTTCSTLPYLDRVVTPTFVLTSQDDPFIPFRDYQSARWNENVHCTFVRAGGHMGYISKSNLGIFKKRWLDHYLFQVLNTIQKI